jgi:hypothetical protein
MMKLLSLSFTAGFTSPCVLPGKRKMSRKIDVLTPY